MHGTFGRSLLAPIFTLLMALLLVQSFPVNPQSVELLDSVGLMSDPTRTMTVETVAQKRFEPVSQTVKFGYSSAAHWLRLHILPDPDGHEIVLIVRPSILDQVILYGPDGAIFGAAPNPTPLFRAQTADWPSSLRGYRITPPITGADYFLKITSTGSIAANVTALPRPAAQRLGLINDIIYIFYFTLLLMLFFWSLRWFINTREPMFGWFSTMQLSWLCHNFFAFGYFTILMPSIDRSTVITVFRIAVIVSALLSVKFHRSVLQRFEPATWAMRLFDILLAVVSTAFVVFWTVDHNLGLQINAWCIAASPLVFLLCGITAKTEVSPGLTAMRWIYGVFSMVLGLWVVSFFGFGKLTIFALYGFMIQGVASGILMFTILELHNRNSFAAAKAAQDKIITMENQRRVELAKTRTMAQFIDMMGHEARNTLAVINMSISGPSLNPSQRARVNDAIGGLTDLIDRCYQTIRIDNQGQSVTQSECDLTAILRKVCDGHIQSKRIVLATPKAAPLESDQVLLAVICGNLIDNALKYSPADSLVHVDLQQQSQGLALVVSNEAGPAGLPDPDQVFQKYYRNPRAKAEIGAGLGLYIVRGLVHLLSGAIAYTPTDGHVSFKVSFPC